jgi:hypothetical protein
VVTTSGVPRLSERLTKLPSACEKGQDEAERDERVHCKNKVARKRFQPYASALRLAARACSSRCACAASASPSLSSGVLSVPRSSQKDAPTGVASATTGVRAKVFAADRAHAVFRQAWTAPWADEANNLAECENARNEARRILVQE